MDVLVENTGKGLPAVGSSARPRVGEGDETEAWRIPGLVAGIQGAAAVALIFLVIDLGAGRAMWTPSVLGARLFQGRLLEPGAGWAPALALGYTLVHGTLFVAVGSIAAQMVASLSDGASERRPSTATLAIALFIAFEATFVGLALLVDRGLLSQLGAGPVAVANLAAATVMAMSLTRRSGARR